MIIRSTQIPKPNKKSWLHTFLGFASHLHNHVTWPLHVIFFCSCWASPLNRLTSSAQARALGWRFYNSKSSISNGSASPFGRITIRASSQWLQDLVLNGALATILRPILLESKMSLPAPKAQQEDQMPVATRLLPLLRLLLQLLFPPPRTFSRNSWRHLWSQPRLGTGSKQNLENDHLRLDPQRPIQGNLIWIAITFVSSVRTISKLQVPLK